MRKTCIGLLFLSFVAACGGGSSDTPPLVGKPGTPDGPPANPPPAADACPATGMGQLTIAITGLPSGVDARAAVDGPGGQHAVPASTSASFVGGMYTVTAEDIVAADAIVRGVYRATVSPASLCVKDGAPATVTVTYALVPTSHALWAANANGAAEVAGFRAESLRASGSPAADVASHVAIPSDVVFDKKGGLWTTRDNGGTRELVHVPASAFAASGDLMPDVVITGAALNEGAPGAAGLAFDAAGNLWVAAPAAGKILRWAAADLAASGSAAPSVVLGGIPGASALAFDAAGNLWTNDDANHVVEYVAARLAASTNAAPDVAVAAQTPDPVVTPQQGPRGLAFDASNNLWVDFDGGAMVRFTPAERAASATVTPAVQVTLDVLALADGMAFDESGGLWFAYTQGKIARLSAAQLGASGTVTPETIITSATLGSAGNVAFYPAPANVPLYAKP
jgi:sugar lactone lactonase YvrE